MLKFRPYPKRSFHSAAPRRNFMYEVRRVLTAAMPTVVAFRRKSKPVQHLKAHYAAQLQEGPKAVLA